MRLLLFLGLFPWLFSSLALGQRTDLHLTVMVHSWEDKNDSAVFNITATDTAANAVPIKGPCSAKGKCRIDLPLDHVYRVELSGEGHVPKHVMMDLNGPGIKQRKWGYNARFKLALMPRIDSVDYSICEKPLGYAHFDAKDNQFTWDEAYTYDLTPFYETMQNRYAEVKRKRQGEP